MDKLENAFTFAWTTPVVESRGWEYEVWREPPRPELENDSLPVTAGTGYSIKTFLPSCARRISTALPWQWHAVRDQTFHRRVSGRRYCICCGNGISHAIWPIR